MKVLCFHMPLVQPSTPLRHQLTSDVVCQGQKKKCKGKRRHTKLEVVPETASPLQKHSSKLRSSRKFAFLQQVSFVTAHARPTHASRASANTY